MRLFEVSPKDAKLILTEGITHISDQNISISKFLEVLKNIKEFEITEKVDGANLWFGLDMEGNLYTSRGKKEGGTFYKQDDWGSDFKDTGFKSAHAALKNKENEIKVSGMNPGDIIEVEVLFGDKPNAIPYWPNQIIFLAIIKGDPDITKIADELEGQTSTVDVSNVPYTDNGKTIQRRDELHNWTFAKVQKYEVDTDKLEAELDKQIKKLEKFLSQPNIAKLELKNKQQEVSIPTNIEVLALRATKPEIKEAKELIKDVIDGDRDPTTGKRIKTSGMRFDIKEVLLDNLVRSAQSTLGPSIEEGGWIEGVVLRRQGTGKDGGDELFKVVDHDIFTAVNSFNHQVRGFLTKKHKGPETARETAGILGNLLRDMATALNHPSLGTIQAKRYLKKFGESPQEIASAIAKDVNVEQSKVKWTALLDKASKLLENLLEQYNDQVEGKKFIDSTGRTHKYDETIHKRTLQAFAELTRDFATWKRATLEATDPEELVMILVGDKLA